MVRAQGRAQGAVSLGQQVAGVMARSRKVITCLSRVRIAAGVQLESSWLLPNPSSKKKQVGLARQSYQD